MRKLIESGFWIASSLYDLKSEITYQIAKFLYLNIGKQCCLYFINEKNRTIAQSLVTKNES